MRNVQVMRRVNTVVNIVIATCIAAAFCAWAGSELATLMAENHRSPTSTDVVLESSVEVPVTDQSELSVGDTADDRHDSVMDLYGNEITSAIATYTLDPSGTVYEEHSPQTEVPHLGVPTT